MKTCHLLKDSETLAGNKNEYSSLGSPLPRFLQKTDSYRYLSPEGVGNISENGQIQDVKVLGKRALDVSILWN